MTQNPPPQTVKPGYPTLHPKPERYKRATAYMIDKKYESALKDLAKVLEIKPDYVQVPISRV